MKNLIRISLLVFALLSPLCVFADFNEVEDLLEIPVEYRDEIKDKFKESREFSEAQIEIIAECLKESSIKGVLNCFSRGGIDEASNILVLIRDELLNIEERLCGKSTLFQKDRCEKIKSNLDNIKKQIGNMWSTTMERGKQRLREKNELITLKRKICEKINQDGCWSWLNERLYLKCNPKKIGTDSQVQEKCRLEAATEVWNRLN
ncbi:hypothetical protein KJ966_23680 [bacterium]|nr:hypothetical protein [bacterium]